MYLGFISASRDIGPEVIRCRQRLAQAVRLRFNTTSTIWKLLVCGILYAQLLWPVDVGPFYSWLKNNTMEALRFVLLFLPPACSHFVLYTSYHIHWLWFQCFIFHAPYHASMLQPLISLCLPVQYKAPSHNRYSCNLHTPRQMQAICQNFKRRSVEVHFLKLHQ